MDILKRVLSRAEELHHILRMIRNYTEPSQRDWRDERAELLIADIKSAQHRVHLTAIGAGAVMFFLGTGVGMLIVNSINYGR